jgi:predicted PurR-regulated permease PerM
MFIVILVVFGIIGIICVNSIINDTCDIANMLTQNQNQKILRQIEQNSRPIEPNTYTFIKNGVKTTYEVNKWYEQNGIQFYVDENGKVISYTNTSNI